MKNILKYFAVLFSGALLLGACVKEQAEPLAGSVKVSSETITLAGATLDSKSVNVEADGDWIIYTASEWFEVSPTSGSGNVAVTVKAKENNLDEYGELRGPRSEKVYVYGDEATVVITVNQEGLSGLDASRTYVKVTSADAMEAGKGYMIVANDGKALQAAHSFAATSDTYYSYIYTDPVEESKENTFVRSNANNGYVFEDAGDGLFYICQPNGRYLFQAAAYNNFYSTDDVAKADKWSVTINADGTAKIVNETIGEKYFQYSIAYASYGAYGSEQSNAALPMLYKDSAAPSDEILVVASNTAVKGDATSVSIPVTSNKTWHVRCHDSWIKSYTREGSGDGAIEVTFDANESYDDARTATFQIIGETTNFEVTLTQDHLYAITDIADIASFLALEDGTQLYRFTGMVTKIGSAKYGNVYIADASDTVYVYGLCEDENLVSQSFGKTGIKEHDIVTVVGQKGSHKGAPQATNAYAEVIKPVSVKTTTEFVALPDDKETYYEVTGKVTSIANDKYGNLYITDGTTELYVYGVTTGYNAKTSEQKQYKVKDYGIEVGDELTMVGYKTTFTDKNTGVSTIELAGGIFISVKKASDTPGGGEEPGKVYTLTAANLPTAYPSEQTVVSEGGIDYYTYIVANYGSGIQMKKSTGAYVANKTAIPNIKSVKVTVADGKTFYPTNLKMYAGTAELPETTEITATSDETSSTYDFSGGSYSYFKLVNTSTYAVYLGKVEISY